MSQRPTLETERLILRPFDMKDAKDVQRLAGARDVASTTLNIPHPYEDGRAEDWISTHQGVFDEGKGIVFAITSKPDGALVGAISLMGINRRDLKAELGYWIGKPFWNQGFCTEAGRAVLEYGFKILGLNRIFARHLSRNPASGRVMEKLGMIYEGRRRQDTRKWDVFEDVEFYGILKSDWEQPS
jgi:RimJ/RimL family protein N-acetyltransferase